MSEGVKRRFKVVDGVSDWMKEETDARASKMADALRRLSQGVGVLQPTYDEPIDDDVLDMFDVADKEELSTKIRGLFDVMPVSKYWKAIYNALGGSMEYAGLTLTERRNKFIDEAVSEISYRTLIRHEQEGALGLARSYWVDTTRRTTTTLELVNRVALLERLVIALVDAQGRESLYTAFGESEAAQALMLQSIIRVDTQARGDFNGQLEGWVED